MVELPNNSTALEIALASLIEDRLDLDAGSVKITLTPANTPDHILPYLAWQEHADYWQDYYSREQKLAIIRTAKQVHSTKGTVGALKLALDNLDIGAELEEWFNYEGDPYYFRIHIKPDHGLSEAEYVHLFEVIEETKNLRSILDKVVTHYNFKSNLYIAATANTGVSITVYPPSLTNQQGFMPVYAGGGAVIKQTIQINPYYPKDQQTLLPIYAGGAVIIKEVVNVK